MGDGMFRLLSQMCKLPSRKRRALRRARPLLVEALEERVVPATTRFAVIGDYGAGNANELAVANMVKSWNPDLSGDRVKAGARLTVYAPSDSRSGGN